MKRLSTCVAVGAAMAAGAAVLGCGGGGGGGGSTGTTTVVTPVTPDPVATVAQGLWRGTTASGRAVTGLVFADGRYYFLYAAAGSPGTVAGLVQGTGGGFDGAFASSDGLDFNLEGQGIVSAVVSATVNAGVTLDATLGSLSVNASYDPAFDTAATSVRVAGTFTGSVAAADEALSVTLHIADDGVLGGDGHGCTIGGSVLPHAATGAYDLSMDFSGTGCPLAGRSYQGVAILDDAAREFRAAAPTADRSDALLVLASRP